jgi:hypothetical protein
MVHYNYKLFWWSIAFNKEHNIYHYLYTSGETTRKASLMYKAAYSQKTQQSKFLNALNKHK